VKLVDILKIEVHVEQKTVLFRDVECQVHVLRILIARHRQARKRSSKTLEDV